jgi:hypothetical protein
MDRGVLRALFVVKRPLVLGVLLASACTLNPQGEDPGIMSETSSGDGTSFVPGGEVVNNDATVNTIDESGTVTPSPGAVSPGSAAGPDGALDAEPPSGATGATGAGVTPPPAATMDPSPVVGAGGSSSTPMSAAGAAAGGAESEAGSDFDGGTFNYSNDQDGGAGDAGAPDAGADL